MANKNETNLLAMWKNKRVSGHFKRQKFEKIKNLFGNSAVCRVNSLDNLFNITERSSPISNQVAASNHFPTTVSTANKLFQFNASPKSNEDDGNVDQGVHLPEPCVCAELYSPDAFDKEKFICDIVCWAIKHRVNNVQLKGLLQIWNRVVPLSRLPSDPRTLLQTPRVINIIRDPKEENELHWYYGLEKSLINTLKNMEKLPDKISLNFNIDGLPI